MVYKRVRGWTSGQSLPILNVVKYPPSLGFLHGYFWKVTFPRRLCDSIPQYDFTIYVEYYYVEQAIYFHLTNLFQYLSSPSSLFTSFQLEHQVSDLKRRLDELRKAKNTTIIKKDKEYITTGTPHVGESTSTGSPDRFEHCSKERTRSLDGELQSKMQESNQQVKTLHENIAALKEMHREELEELKREVEKQVQILLPKPIMYAKGFI